ncbi:hypothetical protein GGH92_008862, partial [Coemansia sp. RSA 2673]
MRFFIAIVALSCLVALCNATYVSLYSNAGYYKYYESNDGKCHSVDSRFGKGPTQVSVSGYRTILYGDSVCQYSVATVDSSNGVWSTVPGGVLSFYSYTVDIPTYFST